ncbi:MAG: rod shape-determining protein MreD [Bacteroidaceae bacterium]
MISSSISRLFLTLAIIALQTVVLNHIHIYGYATPLICVYLIITLPINTPRLTMLTWGFLVGLTQDIFANTPGVMTSTLTLVAMMHNNLLIVLGDQDKDDKDEGVMPSIKTLGTMPFLRYAGGAVLIETTVFYLLMTFNFAAPLDTLINIAGSSILSFLIIWFIESIRSNYIKR